MLDVWPTGGAGGSRASRLVAGTRRAEDVGRNGTERLDLVVPDVHVARRARRGRVDQQRRQVVVGRTAAAHGERHVRSGRDSAWRGVSGEHSDRRTGVSFRTYAAERTVVPHVAANADDVPRRWCRQTYTRPVALVRWPAAAPERNIAEPDGVRLTAPCAPTRQRANAPTHQRTNAPTRQRANAPTRQRANAPTRQRASAPTRQRANAPTRQPTNPPTHQPTNPPTHQPTNRLLVCSSARLLVCSSARSLVCSLSRLLARSLACSLARSSLPRPFAASRSRAR